VRFAAITLCVASQRMFIVVYFVIDSVRKLLDIPSYIMCDYCYYCCCRRYYYYYYYYYCCISDIAITHDYNNSYCITHPPPPPSLQ
jgi:hypothetical protein